MNVLRSYIGNIIKYLIRTNATTVGIAMIEAEVPQTILTLAAFEELLLTQD